jgi:hypothetical protein
MVCFKVSSHQDNLHHNILCRHNESQYGQFKSVYYFLRYLTTLYKVQGYVSSGGGGGQ